MPGQDEGSPGEDDALSGEDAQWWEGEKEPDGGEEENADK